MIQCKLKYTDHSTYLHRANGAQRPKLVIEFEIVSGNLSGELVCAYYNAKRISGKRDFVMNPRAKFVREFYTLFPDQPRHRLDRLPILPFRSVTIQAELEMVTTDNSGDQLPTQMHYPKVEKLVEVKK